MTKQVTINFVFLIIKTMKRTISTFKFIHYLSTCTCIVRWSGEFGGIVLGVTTGAFVLLSRDRSRGNSAFLFVNNQQRLYLVVNCRPIGYLCLGWSGVLIDEGALLN